MKKKQIIGYSFYLEGEDYMVKIFESATLNRYHVVIDSAFQDNEYFHLTKEEIESKFETLKMIQGCKTKKEQKDLTSQMEKFVDNYLIKHNSKPPTYKEIGKYFGLGISATYVRLKGYRHKLKTHESKFGEIKL